MAYYPSYTPFPPSRNVTQDALLPATELTAYTHTYGVPESESKHQPPPFVSEGHLPATKWDNIPHWPAGPSALESSSWQWMDFLADIFTILSTLPFLALGLVVGIRAGKPVGSDGWHVLRNVLIAAASIFPITFAAVAGRTVAKFAAWRLERGVSLGVLEQLMGSKTVFGTLSTQVILRTFNVAGVVLVLFWSLSPLGGQSILRMIQPAFITRESNFLLTYFDTNIPSGFATQDVVSPTALAYEGPYINTISSLFMGSLLTKEELKEGNLDQWGNVKIPMLSSYGNGSTDWIKTPWGGSTRYSSLIGLPVFGEADGNFTFSLESSYLELDCNRIEGNVGIKQLTLLPSLQIMRSGSYHNWTTNGTFQGSNSPNISSSQTSSNSIVPNTWSLGLDTFIDPMWNDTTPSDFNQTRSNIEASTGTLLFQSFDVDNNYHYAPKTATAVYCKTSQVYVESQVLCNFDEQTSSSKNCTVTAQRPSQKTHAPSAITQLSFRNNMNYVSKYMPAASGRTGLSGQADLVSYYLNDTSLNYLLQTFGPAELSNLPPIQVSQRLAQLINSYVLVSQAYVLLAGGPQTTNNGAPVNNNVSTTATLHKLELIYTTDRAWLLLYWVAVVALFAVSVVGVVFARLAKNPEVLGYCSSMVRWNTYIGLPPGGGTMKGTKITKTLRNIRIRQGELHTREEGIVLGVGLEERTARTRKGYRYI